MKRLLLSVIFTFLLLDLFAQGTWTQKNNFENNASCGARYRAATFTIPSTGKGYIIGGSCSSGYQKDLWQYDTTLDAWTNEASYPADGSNTYVTFTLNDTPYVGIGIDGNFDWNSYFYKYAAGANQWIQIPNMPGAGRSYAVGFALNGKGYAGCGLGGGNNINYSDFYCYDPKTNKWDTVQPYPGQGTLCPFGFAIENKGYVGCGSTITGSSQIVFNDVYEFDPDSAVEWKKKNDFPGGPRGEVAVMAFCDRVYIGLGYDNNNHTVHSDFWKYEPKQDTWIQVANYGGQARAYAAGFTIGNTGYVGTGMAGFNSYNFLNDFWKFNDSEVAGFTTANASLTSICAGNSVSFKDTSNFTAIKWKWSFPGGVPDTSSMPNPTVVYAVAGGYDVQLTTYSECGDSSVALIPNYITVLSGASLNITPPQPQVCSGQSVQLIVSGYSGSTLTWSPSTGLNIVSANGDTVIATPTVTTTYSVSTGGNVCASNDSVVVTVGNTAVGGTLTAVRDTICEGTPGNLSLTGISGSPVQWESSVDGVNFDDFQDTSLSYKTIPLVQSTWYKVVVGSGYCVDSSNTLQLYVPLVLTAYFNLSVGPNNLLTFNSDSSLGNIKSYHWDFGDGQTSDEKNPQHTFAKDTVYYVCLTLYDGSNCSYTFCRYTDLSASGVQNVQASGNWNIYPNPFSDELNISGVQPDSRIESIELYNVLGQQLLNKIPGNSSNTTLQLDVSPLAKGMYYVIIRMTNANYIQKVVKQ